MNKSLLKPRLNNGVAEFPVHHMRGGTSTGLVLWDEFLPENLELREELLRHLMGVPLSGPLKGNRQITGLGRGTATSNKVFIVKGGRDDPTILETTFAQLASDHGNIDWSVNCGNMSSALPLWAADTGFITVKPGEEVELTIFNTNTKVTTLGRMKAAVDRGFETASIPGVEGHFPAVDLFMLDPVGAKTGKLLPTGQVTDTILGYSVSCVDVAVPMVIADAAQFGKSGFETGAELEADVDFIVRFTDVWAAAGLRMGLRKRDGSLMTEADLRRSETVPKACLVSAPRSEGNVNVRYFTPQQAHASMAVSGACCLAAAALIPGTVAHKVSLGLPEAVPGETEIVVGIENPAGIMEATIATSYSEHSLAISKAAYRRSAQILARGYVPLYQASDLLYADLMGKL